MHYIIFKIRPFCSLIFLRPHLDLFKVKSLKTVNFKLSLETSPSFFKLVFKIKIKLKNVYYRCQVNL